MLKQDKEDKEKDIGMYLDLLIIAFLMVFIVDCSGIIQSLESGLQRWLKMPNKAHIPKPFSCSLCMTWWTGIIYLICVGELTFLGLGYVAMMAFITPVIMRLMYLVKDTMNKVLELFERLFRL